MRERIFLIYGLFSLCLPLAASANELPKVSGQIVRIELPGDGRTLSPAKVASTEGNAIPGKKTDFHGFDCYEFRTKTGIGVKVVCPEKTAPGKPWLWRSLFWEAIPAFYNGRNYVWGSNLLNF